MEGRQPAGHIVVCGLDHLGLTTIEELLLGGETVAAITAEPAAAEAAALRDLRVVVGDARRESTLRDAGVPAAAAIVLTNADDLANLHTALAAQELNADIRIVLRMFDAELGGQIQALFTNAVALSSSAIAAPGFVAAALDGEGGATFEAVGRIFRARLDGAGGDDAITIARLRPDRTVEVLPAVDRAGSQASGPATDSATLVVESVERPPGAGRRRSSVLDQAREATEGVVSEVGEGVRALPELVRRRRRVLVRPERRLVRFFTILLVLALVSTLYFEFTANLSPLDALLYALSFLLGASLPTNVDPEQASAALKVYTVFLSIIGAAIVAVIFALITDAMIRSRLLQTLGARSVPARTKDHVIVCGLGSIGYRVALGCADRGVSVVVVDKDEDVRFASAARAAGIPVVTGDARHQEILEDLRIESARSVVAATSDDLVNLAVALNARARRPDLRVVVRVFDPDFALRVQRGLGIEFTRSASHLAGPAFAAAALGSEVVAAVPIGDRRIVVFSRLVVQAGAELEGRAVGAIDEVGARRILAIAAPGSPARWRPAPEGTIAAGEELVVATTRSGLARLLEQSRTAAPVPRRTAEAAGAGTPASSGETDA